MHDRGRVLVDTAVCVADGGRVLSDLAVLRDQSELFGSVASDPALWRALEEIGAEQRAGIATARAKTRKQVWALIEARHGQIPPSRVADVDLRWTRPGPGRGEYDLQPQPRRISRSAELRGTRGSRPSSC